MLKNLCSLEHKIGNRIYHLLCDQDSPVNEVKEALSQFLGFAVNVEKEAAGKVAASSVEPPKEEVAPCP